MLCDLYTKEEFDKLSNKEQRIAIAKDVLACLKQGRFIPEGKAYLSLDGEGIFASKFESKDVQELIQDSSIKKCEVCALGSMIYSVVGSYNGFCAKELCDNILAPLSPYFFITELVQIELAFVGAEAVDTGLLNDEFIQYDEDSREWHHRFGSTVISDVEVDAALIYRDRFSSLESDLEPDVILKDIMTNIIQNDGEFVV